MKKLVILLIIISFNFCVQEDSVNECNPESTDFQKIEEVGELVQKDYYNGRLSRLEKVALSIMRSAYYENYFYHTTTEESISLAFDLAELFLKESDKRKKEYNKFH